MTAKKNANIDPEKHRKSFFLIALMTVIGITIVFFNWKSPTDRLNEFNAGSITIDEDQTAITRTEIKPPPPPEKEKIMIPEILILVNSDSDFADTLTIDMGTDEGEGIDIIEVVEIEKPEFTDCK